MSLDLSDWDEDLPGNPEEAYQDLLRALKRKTGFGLFFVQCTPEEAERLIHQLPQDISEKQVATLRLVESIDNLYQWVADYIKDKRIDILLIKGLEYSLYKYEKRAFGEITEQHFSNLSSVPPILNHLNQQRERFRDDFPICFVFLLRSFSINYLIHRAPDFFDWRSGVFELPTTPEVVEEETLRLILEGDYKKYIDLAPEKRIEKVLEIQELLTEKCQTDNYKADLLFILGIFFVAVQEYESAVSAYNQALILNPDFQEARYGQAIVLGHLKRYEEAIISYNQALKTYHDDYEVWFYRGVALKELKRYEEAIVSYDQALKNQPDSFEAWYDRGFVLKELQHYEEAVFSYDQALKIYPGPHEVCFFRGITLGYLKCYEESIISYEKALKIQPDFYEAWYIRGITLRQLKSYEEALISLEQAVRIQPTSHEAWYIRSITLWQLESYEEALTSLNQAIRILINHDA